MIKIAYVGMSQNYDQPGDRRRFFGFSKYKKIKVENYNPNKEYDLIVLSQKADLSYFVKKKFKNTKIIFDFVDAYLHEPVSLKTIFRGFIKYVTGQNKYLNLNYRKLIKSMCKKANHIICTTKKQKEKIKKYNKNVTIILDAHEQDTTYKNNFNSKYFLKKKKIDLFWEGQGGNITSLGAIKNFLKFYLDRNIINLNIVSDKRFTKISGTNIKINTKKILIQLLETDKNIFFYNWNTSNLNKISKKCDLGIIPIDNFKSGMYAHKPANKLHLMWRLGLPTLVSPSPANKDSVLKSKINLLCYNEKSWFKIFEKYRSNKNQIILDKKKIYKHLKKNYSDSQIYKTWNNVYAKVLNNFYNC